MQLVYHGYMNYTGYSVAAQDYILAMLSIEPDMNMRLLPMSNIARGGLSSNRFQIFHGLKSKGPEENAIHIYHCIPHMYRRTRGSKKNIGVCLFETINVPKQWVERMNEMDVIVTGSQFNKSTFEASGVTVPIEVIPHCFDSKMFHQKVRPAGRYAKKTFIAMGTWKQRKNWDNMIKGFYDAFEKKDNVCLVIKTDKPKQLQKTVLGLKRNTEWRSKDTAPIYADEKMACDFEEIPRIMKKGDVYISTSLGEGFGLPGMHAMALGIPVITARFGGALEYAKPDMCTYLEPQRYKQFSSMDGIPQFANCIWPVIRIGEIRDKMRVVAKDTITDKVERAYNYVHKNFNYNVVGSKFLEVIYS